MKGKYISTLFGLFFYAFFYSSIVSAQTCQCDYTIEESVLYVDGSKLNLAAGSTICIKASKTPRRYLKLINFQGAADKYLKFVNCGGQVVIKNSDHAYGISLENCKYFRFTGTGIPSITYGFKIEGTANNASGLSIGSLSTNYEIDHFDISNTGFAGILAKTDPKCDNYASRNSFTQKNTTFHDNYIHHTKGEGIYIGSSFYSGYTINCKGQNIKVFPHLITGLRIYSNRIEYTQLDGIQAGCASEDCEIYNNKILFYGLKGEIGQMSGIQINSGTTGKCYGNLIKDGKGEGIFVAGLGNNVCYNNIIVRAGRSFFPGDTSMDTEVYGIFCDDRDPEPGRSFDFIHNTIISPKSEGIRMLSVLSSNNKIVNNLIIDPGMYDRYENDNTSATGKDSFINVRRKNLKVFLAGNVFVKDFTEAGIADTTRNNYNLVEKSQAVDGGVAAEIYNTLYSSGVLANREYNATKLAYDFSNRTRPFGRQCDPGACEFYPSQVTANEDEELAAAIRLFPNPVQQNLRIDIDYPGASLLQYEICDLSGRRLAGARVSDIAHFDHTIHVADLSPGIYLLRLDLNGRSVVKKFTRQ